VLDFHFSYKETQNNHRNDKDCVNEKSKRKNSKYGKTGILLCDCFLHVSWLQSMCVHVCSFSFHLSYFDVWMDGKKFRETVK
jgi:hypothetical protein